MDLTVVESRELVMGCGKDEGERKLEREREQDYNKNVCVSAGAKWDGEVIQS